MTAVCSHLPFHLPSVWLTQQGLSQHRFDPLLEVMSAAAPDAVYAVDQAGLTPLAVLELHGLLGVDRQAILLEACPAAASIPLPLPPPNAKAAEGFGGDEEEAAAKRLVQDLVAQIVLIAAAEVDASGNPGLDLHPGAEKEAVAAAAELSHFCAGKPVAAVEAVEAGVLRPLVTVLGRERKDPLRPKADRLLRVLAAADRGAREAISALKRELYPAPAGTVTAVDWSNRQEAEEARRKIAELVEEVVEMTEWRQPELAADAVSEVYLFCSGQPRGAAAAVAAGVLPPLVSALRLKKKEMLRRQAVRLLEVLREDPVVQSLILELVEAQREPRRAEWFYVQSTGEWELRKYYLGDRTALPAGAARQGDLDALVRTAQPDNEYDFGPNGVGFALFKRKQPDLSAAAIATLPPPDRVMELAWSLEEGDRFSVGYAPGAAAVDEEVPAGSASAGEGDKVFSFLHRRRKAQLEQVRRRHVKAAALGLPAGEVPSGELGNAALQLLEADRTAEQAIEAAEAERKARVAEAVRKAPVSGPAAAEAKAKAAAVEAAEDGVSKFEEAKVQLEEMKLRQIEAAAQGSPGLQRMLSRMIAALEESLKADQAAVAAEAVAVGVPPPLRLPDALEPWQEAEETSGTALHWCCTAESVSTSGISRILAVMVCNIKAATLAAEEAAEHPGGMVEALLNRDQHRRTALHLLCANFHATCDMIELLAAAAEIRTGREEEEEKAEDDWKRLGGDGLARSRNAARLKAKAEAKARAAAAALPSPRGLSVAAAAAAMAAAGRVTKLSKTMKVTKVLAARDTAGQTPLHALASNPASYFDHHPITVAADWHGWQDQDGEQRTPFDLLLTSSYLTPWVVRKLVDASAGGLAQLRRNAHPRSLLEWLANRIGLAAQEGQLDYIEAVRSAAAADPAAIGETAECGRSVLHVFCAGRCELPQGNQGFLDGLQPADAVLEALVSAAPLAFGEKSGGSTPVDLLADGGRLSWLLVDGLLAASPRFGGAWLRDARHPGTQQRISLLHWLCLPAAADWGPVDPAVSGRPIWAGDWDETDWDPAARRSALARMLAWDAQCLLEPDAAGQRPLHMLCAGGGQVGKRRQQGEAVLCVVVGRHGCTLSCLLAGCFQAREHHQPTRWMRRRSSSAHCRSMATLPSGFLTPAVGQHWTSWQRGGS